MADKGGRQSPRPEDQSPSQGTAVAGSGQGIDDASGKDKRNDDAVAGLESNPTHPLEQAAKDKVKKTVGPNGT